MAINWRMTFSPFTKATFSPLPTLFFTLLTSLLVRDIIWTHTHSVTHIFAPTDNKKMNNTYERAKNPKKRDEGPTD